MSNIAPPPLSPITRFENAYSRFNNCVNSNRQEARTIFSNTLQPVYLEIIPPQPLCSRIWNCLTYCCIPPAEESEELKIVRERFQFAQKALRTPSPKIAVQKENPVLPEGPVPGVGFKNASANCWCNALLQLIIHSAPLREAYVEFAEHLRDNGCTEAIAEGNQNLMGIPQAAYDNRCKDYPGKYPLSSIINPIIPRPPAPPRIPAAPNDLLLEEEDPFLDLCHRIWTVIKAVWTFFTRCFNTPVEPQIPPPPEPNSATKQAWRNQFTEAFNAEYDRLSEAEAPLPEDAKPSALVKAFNARLTAALTTARDQMRAEEAFAALSQQQQSAILYNTAYLTTKGLVGKWVTAHRTTILGPPPPPPPSLEAIQESAKQHGERLLEALTAYETSLNAGTPVPHEVSQNVRLAFAFLFVNNHPRISPHAYHQEDAHEILGSWIDCYEAHLGHAPAFAIPMREIRQYVKTDEKFLPEPSLLQLPRIPSFKIGEITLEEGWPPLPAADLPPAPDLPPVPDLEEVEEAPAVDLLDSLPLKNWKELIRKKKTAVNETALPGKPSRKERQAFERSKTLWRQNIALTEQKVTAWEKKTRTLQARQQAHERKAERNEYTVLGDDFISNGPPPAREGLFFIEINPKISHSLQDLFIHTLSEIPTEDSESMDFQYQNDYYVFKPLLSLKKFYGVPPNLLINIVRQQQINNRFLKNNTPIDIPPTLSFPKENIEAPPDHNPEYELKGFLRHTGKDMTSGHYIGYWKDPVSGYWVEADDSQTSWLSEAKALQLAKDAYVLSYELMV